jgi:C-terminal processing protease CtpA/Prc
MFTSRFTDKKRPFFISRTKNGPQANDLTEPKTWYITPGGNKQYTGPIVVLINGRSFEGRGIPPNINNALSKSDLVAGTDTQLFRAILELDK